MAGGNLLEVHRWRKGAEGEKTEMLVKVTSDVVGYPTAIGVERETGSARRSTRTFGMIVGVRFYADLHIHSKFSRACSRDCDLEHLAWWAGRKGIGVVGSGDFTHPAWREELGAKLVPDAPGLFRLRPELERAVHETLPPACRTPVRFMLSSDDDHTLFKQRLPR
jgi:hypothetical protein